MERDIGRAILGLRIQLIEIHIHFYFSSSLVSLRGKMGTCVDGDLLLHSRGRASGGGGRARGGWRKKHIKLNRNPN